MAFFYFNRESPSTPSTLIFYSTNYYFHRRKKSGDSFFHPPHLPHCFRLSSIPFGHRVFFSSTICGFDVLDDIRVGKSPHTLRILVKYKGGLFSRFFYATLSRIVCVSMWSLMDVVESEWSLLSILNFLLNLLELLIKICLVEEWRVKTQKSSKKSKFEKQILGLKMKFKLKVDFSIEKTNLFFEKKTNSSRKSQNKPKYVLLHGG